MKFTKLGAVLILVFLRLYFERNGSMWKKRELYFVRCCDMCLVRHPMSIVNWPTF